MTPYKPVQLSITLRAALEARACEPAYSVVCRVLGRGLGLEDPIPLVRILELRGLDETL